jgi:large subunit ribosomal protein L5
MMARLKETYNNEILPALMTEHSYKNTMEVPKVTKVIVNMGVGEAKTEAKAIDGAVKDLAAITGQKPIVTRAKKSIASFKLREGMQIGVKVTMRGERMYEFLDRLLSLALPRVRDFKGLNDKFDGDGNYTLGLTEQLVFPEIDYDSIDKTRGMNITIVTTAKTDEEAKTLLTRMGFPFKKD